MFDKTIEALTDYINFRGPNWMLVAQAISRHTIETMAWPPGSEYCLTVAALWVQEGHVLLVKYPGESDWAPPRGMIEQPDSIPHSAHLLVIDATDYKTDGRVRPLMALTQCEMPILGVAVYDAPRGYRHNKLIEVHVGMQWPEGGMPELDPVGETAAAWVPMQSEWAERFRYMPSLLRHPSIRTAPVTANCA